MFKSRELLSEHTTFKTGGEAERFSVVDTKKALGDALVEANSQALPITVIGGGSNILAKDDGVEGLVIKNCIGGLEVLKHTKDVICVKVGAGEVFDRLVYRTVNEGWWGLENLSAIPGSVGAVPIQNVGAYGVEVSSFITEVEAVHKKTQTERIFSREECHFGYRDSFFKTTEGKEWIVTAVTFCLSKTACPILEYKDLKAKFAEVTNPSQQKIRETIIEIRNQKFPDWHKVGTAGSFFKNPIIPKVLYDKLLQSYPELPAFPVSENSVKVPLGWILDKVCGLKGVREGNVGTYEGQALVVVSYGDTTTKDILHFTKFIERTVLEKTGIKIEREVTLI